MKFLCHPGTFAFAKELHVQVRNAQGTNRIFQIIPNLKGRQMSPGAPSGAIPKRHQEFLIQDIMPKREVHLLAGPSGAGKTTLAVQIIKSYLAGDLIWSKATNPQGVVYISCDRSMASLHRSLDRHGIDQSQFPAASARVICRSAGLPGKAPQVLKWALDKHPQAHLVIIDGLASLIPEGKLSDYSTVCTFLLYLADWCETNDKTILGLVHATKVKDSEKISNPRQQILGSVAWAAFSDLAIVVNPEDPEDTDNQNRIVRVLPRDAAEFTVRYTNQSGHLVEAPDIQELDYQSILYQELASFPKDRIIPTREFHELGEKFTIPLRTVERWITAAVEGGRIDRVGKGKYRKLEIM